VNFFLEGGKEREAIPGRFDRSIPTAKRGGKKVKGNRNFCHWHEEDGGTNKLPFLCHITEGEYVFLFPFLSSPLLFTAAGLAFLGSERRAPSLRRDGAGGRRGRGRRRRGGGGGRGGRGRRVAVAVAMGAAAVEAALEGACVRGRRTDALGRGAMAVAVGGRGGRPAPPHRLGRRRRAGRRRAVVAVAVEPALVRHGVDVVGRHQPLLVLCSLSCAWMDSHH